MAYEDVERVEPCVACGSRRYTFDGRDRQCVRCDPSALSSPVRVELKDTNSSKSAGEIDRWPSVRDVSACEITISSVG